LTESSIEFVFAVLIVFMLTERRKHIAWCENVSIKNDIAWCNIDVYDCIGEDYIQANQRENGPLSSRYTIILTHDDK
jgi:hypothetical protein